MHRGPRQDKFCFLAASFLTQFCFFAGFMCFKAFFENVNSHEHKLKTSNQVMIVEKPDLIGMDYLWRVVLEACDEEIATCAIKLLMQLTYTHLSPKLKKVLLT